MTVKETSVQATAIPAVPGHMGTRLPVLPPSGTMAVGAVVRNLRARGIDVIGLGGGIAEPAPDCLAQPVRFREERNVGSDPAGEMDLRIALAGKLKREHGLAYDPLTEIVVTVGAKQAVYSSLLALIDPGDEVLVLDPSWVSYAPAVMLAGGVVKPVTFKHDRTFRLDEAALRAQVTPRTRVMILNTPHNPTGRVFTIDELKAAARVAVENDLWVMSDESFDKFVFDGHRHVSIATLERMRDRTIVIQSFSKSFALPGARVGYLVAPAPVCRAVSRFNEHVITCVSPLMQSVALSALGNESEWTNRLLSHYREKRRVAHEALSRISGMKLTPTEGTFYAFPDITAFGMSSEDFTVRLLEEARVAVTPGSAFGDGAEGYVRINLVGPTDSLREGLSRMHEALG